jgi:hypothetical protein
MKLFRLGLFVTLATLGAGANLSAHADGSGYVGGGRPESFATPGSDASFDKRLPPVLPGEEVSDGKNRMKMWSTTGPVPVAPAPEPWKESVQERNRLWGSGVGVIVDQREGRR